MSLANFIQDDNDKLLKNAKRAPSQSQIEKRRKVLLDGVDKTLGQIQAGEDRPKRGWYKRLNEELYAATVKAGRSTMQIENHTELAIPQGKLVAFYEAVKKEVAAGKLDAEINATYDQAAKPQRRKASAK